MGEELRYPVQFKIPEEEILDIDIIHEEQDKITRKIGILSRGLQTRMIVNELGDPVIDTNGEFMVAKGRISLTNMIKLKKLEAEFNKMAIEQAKWIIDQLIEDSEIWEAMNEIKSLLKESYEKAVRDFESAIC